MGVTGLWTVLQPCAHRTKIETLNRKRLAVDASIWIYQFLKAVRDKEGNALRNSHIVGFFRRICKLLFFGIKPIFVFDGGAPVLKRQTISGRKQRREGRREDAVRTAGKLLALQMQRRAEEEDQKRRDAAQRPAQRQEEELPEELVYVDELQMTQQERQQSRKFKKKDQYHLPDLDVSMSEIGGPNDPRVMSMEDLENYARQFDAGEDINVYDFSKIDFNSLFFMSLPASDRYNILNAARLRSRLRMGYSKDQLDTMFPDRMAFSKFQIERVKERNELTQRLMNLNGSGDDASFGTDGAGRVAGEKGREYVLVKNAGVEGGWALGVIGDRDEGERNKPINVDELGKQFKEEDDDEEVGEDDGFEDVPIEGLNRLPKLSSAPKMSAEEVATRNTLRKRTAQFSARRSMPKSKPIRATPLRSEDSNSLFVDQAVETVTNDEGTTQAQESTEDEELQQAIAMSLEPNDPASSPEVDDFEEVFHDQSQTESNSRSAGLQRTGGTKARSAASAAPAAPFLDDSDDDAMDFVGALAESRQPKYQPRNSPPPAVINSGKKNVNETTKSANQLSRNAGFEGPLPFEKLDLGSSLLGKKKAKQIEESMAGGFEKDHEKTKKKAPVVLPPWFSGDLKKDMEAQKAMDDEDRLKERERAEEEAFAFQTRPKLRMQDTAEVIDVDALTDRPKEIINVESGEDDDDEYLMPRKTMIVDSELRNGDIADKIRAEPPQGLEAQLPGEMQSYVVSPSPQVQDEKEVEEPYEWDASDDEGGNRTINATQKLLEPVGGRRESPQMPSHSPEFENVGLPDVNSAPPPQHNVVSADEEDYDSPQPLSGVADDRTAPAHNSDDEMYSDPEDEELMHQLALEAEEHARFASSVNHKTQRQNMEDYERELKALRTQQKKDRRDADEVTHVMVSECQQLLKLFGLPYITAPMEAEAQCAELVSLGLVDGIVTDDSDIFLFGGTRVYKNMFNQAKFVECYLSTDLEREFDLTRQKLIRIAHLLGSDYTEGLPGVGPVTALEILSEFPKGLEEFRDWWTRVQTGARPTEVDNASPFRRKFRRNSAKIFLPPSFPDQRVDIAYLNPDVDKDPSQFEWGVPDLDSLRAFLMATIGWSSERTDEVLVPVIKDMNRRATEGTQANITTFMGAGATIGAGAFAPRKRAVGKSKRMEQALGKMAARAKGRRGAAVDDDGPPHRYAGPEDGALLGDDDAIIAVQGSLAEADVAGDQDSANTNGKRKAVVSTRAKKKRKPVPDEEENVSDDGIDGETVKPKKRRVKQKS